MRVDAYRLWQHWQQMHYPRRGLPVDEPTRARLVTLDGIAGTVLDRFFRRGLHAGTLDVSARAALAGCRRELEQLELSADARRYFSRLQLVMDLVLSEARDPGTGVVPAAADESP